MQPHACMWVRTLLQSHYWTKTCLRFIRKQNKSNKTRLKSAYRGLIMQKVIITKLVVYEHITRGVSGYYNHVQPLIAAQPAATVRGNWPWYRHIGRLAGQLMPVSANRGTARSRKWQKKLTTVVQLDSTAISGDKWTPAWGVIGIRQHAVAILRTAAKRSAKLVTQ